MPEQAATIDRSGQAFNVMKTIQGEWLYWSEGWRPPARARLGRLIQDDAIAGSGIGDV
jgi:hypothetical protein